MMLQAKTVIYYIKTNSFHRSIFWINDSSLDFFVHLCWIGCSKNNFILDIDVLKGLIIDIRSIFDSRGLGVYNLYNIYLIFRIQPSTDCLHILAPLKDICLYYMFNKFLYHCLVTMIYLIFCKICYFYQSYILFNLCQDSLKVFLKVLINVIPFLSFKGAAFAYLLKLLTTHKKSRNPLFYVLINCISAISGHQI